MFPGDNHLYQARVRERVLQKIRLKGCGSLAKGVPRHEHINNGSIELAVEDLRESSDDICSFSWRSSLGDFLTLGPLGATRQIAHFVVF
jgi:hypothetical protein